MATTRKTQNTTPAKSQVYALHSYEFEILTEQIRGTHTRIDSVETRIDSLEKNMTAQFGAVDRRIDDVKTSVDKLDKRISLAFVLLVAGFGAVISLLAILLTKI